MYTHCTCQFTPSFNVETVSQSSLKLVPHSSDTILKNFFLHPKKLTMQLSFFLACFHFHHTVFVGLYEPWNIISKSVHTLVCLIIHSFLVRLQPNLTQHLSSVCSTSEITYRLLLYLRVRDTFTVHVNSFHNLDPLQIICI